MATVEETVKVAVVTDRSPNIIRCSSTMTAEELCIILCKKYKIPPLTRTLFALRVKGRDYFLKDNAKVLSSTRDYELRIRYKVPRLELLITLDETTYDYYFLQARSDVYENRIPEIKYPEHKKEMLGLGIADMTRATAEEKLSVNDVVRDYKKYIPKVIVRRHGHVAKKHAHDQLPKLCSVGHNVNYIKNLYLQQLYIMAPNYLAEEYDNVLWQNGNDVTPVNVVVAPFHPHQPGIRIFNTVKRDWIHVCKIEELIYITRNGENSLEISRRGTPLFFKFKSEEHISSFISLCDGYYRLMVKWTFNLSKDDETPSLKELQRIKCHGPVGGAFSYRKLEEKRAKKHGCYILRQCQDDYNVYYLDVCTKNSTTETYRIEFKGHCYVVNNEEYYSIERLVGCHQNPEGRIFLNECIPPSEYDKSQLLLCGEPVKRGVRIDQAELQDILKDNKSPRCLPNKDILLYTGSEKVGSENITATYKALWRLDETKKLVVAFKTLQREKANDHLKDFVELASKWACVQSSSMVRLYGVTLSSPTALVLEYLPYGPFDDYLRENEERIKPLHLKKVAAQVARALWDLSEAGVVHGHIRCRRLLLAAHTADRINVKLSGPTLSHYTQHDVHWMPVEFFSDMSLAKRSVTGDIWAFATTLWEVFSYGQSPTETNPVLTARYLFTCYMNIVRITELRDGRPVAAAGAVSGREYVPIHEYEEPKISLEHMEHAETVSSDRFIPSELSDAGSNKSLISDSSVLSMNGTMSDQYDNPFADNKSSNSLESMNGLPYGLRNSLRNELRSRNSGSACGARALDDDLDADTAPAPRLMESIVSQGKTYLVTLTKKIGSGNYGHVFKGWMERDNQESQRREVAVKKLTRQASERNGTLYEDFKNELEIMKGMDHVSAKNVVHRDLATRNILVVNKYHVKISDFGLARIIPKEENAYRLKTERLLPINWYAPESAVEPWHFSTKSDVWSYGVTAWEIFTRARQEVPKFNPERPRERASCFQIPEGCPSEIFRHLMKDCWNLDPTLRPKFIDLVHMCKRFMDEYK
ncbi:hypothetical protein HF086_008911 [Spodoptera exigua]|uniref:non-specific protein-tyrosine kinase n=1 Tax=Spodoptera exigua TaxID=7107 RepID=A0A922MTM4_SPOEX|nr:hypothetical protein HF086_008911 [Spodoptera exigua]